MLFIFTLVTVLLNFVTHVMLLLFHSLLNREGTAVRCAEDMALLGLCH